MDLTRILMLLLQGASIDTPIFNKDAPSPPKIPDPANQVRAQAQATPSVYTPTGNQIFSGDPTGADPTKPYRLDISNSPEQQALLEGRTGVSKALLDAASAKVGSMPAVYEPDPNSTTSKTFFNAQRELLDDVFKKDEERLDQKLANQGLPTGSEGNESAADYEKRQFQLNKDRAYSQAAASALGEDRATRQQNLNEVAQALGIQQLNNPSGGGSGGIDVSGAFANQQAGINRNYQGQLAEYNADTANTNTGIAATAAIVAAMI